MMSFYFLFFIHFSTLLLFFFFFFFNDTATTEIYTLSLHDALPIYNENRDYVQTRMLSLLAGQGDVKTLERSEEHTSELQSHLNLVCRLLLEKKKKRSRLNPHLLVFYL